MTPQEMRVLQEFRRVAKETLPLASIDAIKHPAGGGKAPALSLVAKGYLAADATGENSTRSIPRSSISFNCPFSSDARISSSLIFTPLFDGFPICEICRARKTRRPEGTVV